MAPIDPRRWEGPQWLLVGLVVVLLAAALYAGTTSAAAFGAYNPAWDGSEAVRDLATEQGQETVVARSTSEYGGVTPNDSVAFVLSPEREYGGESAEDVRSFVQEGGTLVVSGDVGTETNALLASIGVESRIDGRPLRDEREYTRSPAFPIAETTDENASVTVGVETLGLNYASAVEPGADASVLARSSAYSYLDTDRDDELDDDERLAQRPVVVVEEVGEGQVIVLSDPSLFINAMLEEEDNRAFVTNLLATGETVVFDYSHSGGVPVLVQIVLTLRGSSLGQLAVLIGILGLGALAIRREAWLDAGWLPWRTAEDEYQGLSDADRVAAIEARHPDWDPERVRRVAKRVNPQSPDSTDND